jgi:hypothetical protein
VDVRVPPLPVLRLNLIDPCSLLSQVFGWKLNLPLRGSNKSTPKIIPNSSKVYFFLLNNKKEEGRSSR